MTMLLFAEFGFHFLLPSFPFLSYFLLYCSARSASDSFPVPKIFQVNVNGSGYSLSFSRHSAPQLALPRPCCA